MLLVLNRFLHVKNWTWLFNNPYYYYNENTNIIWWFSCCLAFVPIIICHFLLNFSWFVTSRTLIRCFFFLTLFSVVKGWLENKVFLFQKKNSNRIIFFSFTGKQREKNLDTVFMPSKLPLYYRAVSPQPSRTRSLLF